MVSPRLPAAPQLTALVAPDTGMEQVAKVGRVRWPLLFAVLCSLAMGGAEALRVDARLLRQIGERSLQVLDALVIQRVCQHAAHEAEHAHQAATSRKQIDGQSYIA